MLLTLAALFVCSTFFISFDAPTEAGSIIKPGDPGEPNTWEAGDTPANLNPNAPVLVFVHGLNGSGSTWYGSNDMYSVAYNAGYQTAFVNLSDVGGEPQNMWVNGAMLAELIEDIHAYYERDIVLIAHSKGGVDSQAALVHSSAYPYVTDVYTLGSPHHGSQLADLSYSFWAGWLATILGARSEGTYSLQTGYMSYFRDVTDDHINVGQNEFYTLAGTRWGGFGSALYWGGLYLSAYGTNDGAVVESFAHLPTGNIFHVDRWHHDDIKHGSTVFPHLHPHLNSHEFVHSDSHMNTPAIKSHETARTVSFIRGGRTDYKTEETFLVESDVDQTTLTWMSDQPVNDFHLISTNGDVVKTNVQSGKDDQLFSGAYHYLIEMKNPQQGEWQLQAVQNKKQSPAAYLMIVSYDSAVNDAITFTSTDSTKRQWHVQIDPTKASIDTKQTTFDYRVEFIPEQGNKGKQHSVKVVDILQTQKPQLNIPNHGAGVYNVTVDLQGKMNNGTPFARTLIHTIYIDDQRHVYSR